MERISMLTVIIVALVAIILIAWDRSRDNSVKMPESTMNVDTLHIKNENAERRLSPVNPPRRIKTSVKTTRRKIGRDRKSRAVQRQPRERDYDRTPQDEIAH